jgi:hypothetical protein
MNSKGCIGRGIRLVEVLALLSALGQTGVAKQIEALDLSARVSAAPQPWTLVCSLGLAGLAFIKLRAQRDTKAGRMSKS